jgi:hypothetical protein
VIFMTFRAGTILAVCLVCSTNSATHAQTIIAVTRSDGDTQVRLSKVDLETGAVSPVSPLGPLTYGGLAGAPNGRLYGTTSAAAGAPQSKLYSIDVASNTPTLIGEMAGDPGVSFQSLDIMADGRAFAVSIATAILFPQLFSVDLATAAITPVGDPRSIADAIIAAGNEQGYFATVGALGSVGDRLYTIDLRTNTLVSLDPATGAAAVVGGVPGLLRSGDLSNGVARSRYGGLVSLTGVDTDRDGELDTLVGGVSNWDNDNDPTTPPVGIGGVARFDLSTGLWDLIGVNPGIRFSSMAFVTVPEPSAGLLAAVGLWVVGAAGRMRRRPHGSYTLLSMARS